MVAMFVNGEKVGTLADAVRAIPEAAAKNQRVEFREDDGRVIGTFNPVPAEPLVPWDPTITWEDVEKIRAGEFVTWEEAKKRMGWE